MRTSSVAIGAVAFAAAAFAAVPATASALVRDASGTPMCATSQLSVALGGVDGAAGNFYTNMVFTNHSGSTCHLTGYPGLSMLDASGKQIGRPATRDPFDYAPVVLKPGATASDTIHTVDQQGTCLPASKQLRVYPPGNTASVVFPGQVTDCYNTFTVTPLLAGVYGNPPNAQPTPTPTTTSTGPSTGSSGGSSATPTPSATPSTTASGGSQQVTAVPSGAPDTGLAESGSGGSDNTAVVAGSAAGVLAAAALGTAVVRRRRSQARD
jgi:hypothetical protein